MRCEHGRKPFRIDSQVVQTNVGPDNLADFVAADYAQWVTEQLDDSAIREVRAEACPQVPSSYEDSDITTPVPIGSATAHEYTAALKELVFSRGMQEEHDNSLEKAIRSSTTGHKQAAITQFFELLLVRATLTADAPSKLVDFTDSAPIYLGDCAEEASLALNFWTPPPSSTDAFISSPASRHSFSGHVGWPPVTAMTNPLLYFMQLLLVRATLTADAPSKLVDFTDSAPIYLGDCAEEASLALNFWTPPPSSTDAFISSPASRHSFTPFGTGDIEGRRTKQASGFHRLCTHLSRRLRRRGIVGSQLLDATAVID
ncbi:hypothetical protein MTO96_024734 [Rhipicephalus appendiculatus]